MIEREICYIFIKTPIFVYIQVHYRQVLLYKERLDESASNSKSTFN